MCRLERGGRVESENPQTGDRDDPAVKTNRAWIYAIGVPIILFDVLRQRLVRGAYNSVS